MTTRLVSVVVPVFNEAESVGPFLVEMEKAAADVARRFAGAVALELVFVDDGSRDETIARILAAEPRGMTLRIIELSRNFGKEAAMSAGLTEAAGDAVAIIDVDLQDPPELIPDMIDRWLEGAKVVLARRNDRSEDSYMKRRTAGWFYALHNLISDVQIPHNVGDFRLMDREVVTEVNRLSENRRFMKGIFAWVGFDPVIIEYKRPARETGTSKFSGWRLWRFAIEGITSFSAAPLVMWTYIGFAISALSLAYAILVILRTLIFGVDVPGFASLLVGILFLGGIQLLGIGIMGEYIGRIYSEVKRRPPYVVARRHEGPSSPAAVRPDARAKAGKAPRP
ncbi:MAG: glycosyltransferase [Mesorhizobium sp.]|nr:glycosyltransferase [Mesorhizobium sp.]